MILRQFCARHGRSAVQTPRAILLRRQCLATSADTQLAAPGRDTVAPVISYVNADANQTAVALETQNPNADSQQPIPQPPKPQENPRFKEYLKWRKQKHIQSKMGSVETGPSYRPHKLQQNAVPIEDVTLPMLLACQTHFGHATSLWNPRNSSYITGERDGIHIISLEVTAAYLKRACKVVREVAKRGGLILFIGTRDGQEDIVVRAARLAGGYHIFDHWVPGSLTNGQQILGHCSQQIVDGMDQEITKLRPYLNDQPAAKPDLVVCLNPLENEVCLHECGIYNIPTIGVIDTDADASWVTYPIPANDDSLRAMTLVAGSLAESGKRGQNERLDFARQGELTYPPLNMKRVMDYSGTIETDEAPVLESKGSAYSFREGDKEDQALRETASAA